MQADEDINDHRSCRENCCQDGHASMIEKSPSDVGSELPLGPANRRPQLFQVSKFLADRIHHLVF
ncbi:MAG: hypothetical protein ABFD90_02450 [Phycisphaerales bacterium]